MAITTLAELRTAVANWMDRTLTDALVDEFLSLAQAKMYQGDIDPITGAVVTPPLRIRAMRASGTLFFTDGEGSLAGLTRFLEPERISYSTATETRTLSYVPAHSFRDDVRYIQSGEPEIYTIEGDTIFVAPKQDVDVSIGYYQRFAPLTLGTDTDWVLTNAPHVYLHGVLAEAWEWEGTVERASKERGKFGSAVNAVNLADRRSETKGSALRMRPTAVA